MKIYIFHRDISIIWFHRNHSKKYLQEFLCEILCVTLCCHGICVAKMVSKKVGRTKLVWFANVSNTTFLNSGGTKYSLHTFVSFHDAKVVIWSNGRLIPLSTKCFVLTKYRNYFLTICPCNLTNNMSFYAFDSYNFMGKFQYR